MQSFTKHERLTGQKIIEELFSEGKSFTINPIRMIWLTGNQSKKYPAGLLISVSKKKIKKAVDRNLIKRRIREAYRKNKDSFYEYLNNQEINCVFAFIYISETVVSLKEIEEKIILLLLRFQSEYEKSVR